MLPVLYGINAFGGKASVLCGKLAGIRERYLVLTGTAKPHFPTPTMNCEAQYPLPAAIGPFDEAEAQAVLVLAWFCVLNFYSSEFAQPLNPPKYPPKYGGCRER